MNCIHYISELNIFWQMLVSDKSNFEFMKYFIAYHQVESSLMLANF